MFSENVKKLKIRFKNTILVPDVVVKRVINEDIQTYA
jgi:hypothetical protein